MQRLPAGKVFTPLEAASNETSLMGFTPPSYRPAELQRGVVPFRRVVMPEKVSPGLSSV
jgi:hypothetical protein